MSALVCNIFGSPGSGKTTAAFGIVSALKRQGVLAEYAGEAIKHRMYRNTDKLAIDNQIILLAEQFETIAILAERMEVVVTDSPILLQLAYHNGDNSSGLQHETRRLFEKFDNLNFFLERKHNYDQRDRYQNEEEAEQKALQIKGLLLNNYYMYDTLQTDTDVVSTITEEVIRSIYWLK